jgi:hypothetical protein
MQKLLSAIFAYEAKCGIDTPESILDTLWYDYFCRAPVDDGQIRQSEERLSPVFAELSVEASDQLFGLISDLLTAYQRAAYLDGLRLGANLILELQLTHP